MGRGAHQKVKRAVTKQAGYGALWVQLPSQQWVRGAADRRYHLNKDLRRGGREASGRRGSRVWAEPVRASPGQWATDLHWEGAPSVRAARVFGDCCAHLIGGKTEARRDSDERVSLAPAQSSAVPWCSPSRLNAPCSCLGPQKWSWGLSAAEMEVRLVQGLESPICLLSLPGVPGRRPWPRAAAHRAVPAS